MSAVVPPAHRWTAADGADRVDPVSHACALNCREEMPVEMNDMVIVSVDDHISEPPDMFARHLSAKDQATAPKFCTTSAGTNYWEYYGMRMPAIGLNAVV